MLILLGLALSCCGGVGRAPGRAEARGGGGRVAAGWRSTTRRGSRSRRSRPQRCGAGTASGARWPTLEPWSALVLVPAALAVLRGLRRLRAAPWALTVGYRATARARGWRAAPGAYTGRIPRRVRRQSPAALAAYELPMGLLGFPGVGLAVRRLPVDGARCCSRGPRARVGGHPARVLAVRQGPAAGRRLAGGVRVAPARALLSTALLYRAHRRRLAAWTAAARAGACAPARAVPGRSGARAAGARGCARTGWARPSCWCWWRSRWSPRSAASARGRSATPTQTRLTPEITGEFLSTPHGRVKLFSWQDPQNPYPGRCAARPRAPVRRAALSGSAAVDAPDAYRLFDLARGGACRLRDPQALGHLARCSRRPGRWRPAATCSSSTHEGMFGGRDFSYLRVVAPGAAVTPIGAATARRPRWPTPSCRWRPPCSRRSSWRCCCAPGAGGPRARSCCGPAGSPRSRSPRRGGGRPAGGLDAGALPLLLPGGGVLTVAWLGAGSAWLQLPRRAPRRAGRRASWSRRWPPRSRSCSRPWTPAALAATRRAGARRANDALGGHAFLWAIALNSVGSVLLLGGALYSIAAPPARAREPVDRAAGRWCSRRATSMSRAGDYSLVYLGELVGDRADVLRLHVHRGAARPPAPAPPAQPAARAAARGPGRWSPDARPRTACSWRWSSPSTASPPRSTARARGGPRGWRRGAGRSTRWRWCSRWRSRSSRLAFLRSDFSFAVVAEHSSTTTPGVLPRGRDVVGPGGIAAAVGVAAVAVVEPRAVPDPAAAARDRALRDRPCCSASPPSSRSCWSFFANPFAAQRPAPGGRARAATRCCATRA